MRWAARMRPDSACVTGCESTLTQTVWDGDQVLYEIQYDGDRYYDPVETTLPSGGNHNLYGRVGYTHGTGIDAPLELMRMGLSTTSSAPVVIVPTTNSLGNFDGGVQVAGDSLDVWWPAARTPPGSSYRVLNPPPSWVGSLIGNKRDQSGLLYMRNRYYDANTGQFTQQDPIGLAGGLNTYGFAGGDPVSYGDPYGLCKVELQFTPAGGVGQHTTIVTTSPNGSQHFWSGGPQRTRNSVIGGSAGSAGSSSQSSGNTDSPSSNSSAPGAGPTNGNPNDSFFGDLRMIDGKYVTGKPEFQPQAPRTTVLNNNESCDRVHAAFSTASEQINNANIAYNPFTRNSNSAAHYLLTSAGLRGSPGWRVVAWNANVFGDSESSGSVGGW